MDATDTTADLMIAQAARNLGRARRHAVVLERLAVSILTFGLVSALLLAVVEPVAIWPAAWGALVSAVVWGVLRALALLLHLRVDQTMVELDE